MSFSLKDYLRRIGVETCAPGLEGLFQIQQHQFFNIPFENLDIHLGREINLSPSALMAKLVHQNRGGYCFELNGLMLLALRELGYQAKPLLARVHTQDIPSGRTHQITGVRWEGQTWILDSGFGAGGPRMPLRLIENESAELDSFAYRFQKTALWGWLLETWEGGMWKSSYSFDLSHVSPNDIALGNFYTSHSPQSHFTQVRIAGLPTKGGRLSLRDFTLTSIEHGEKTQTPVSPGEAYITVLKQHFCLELDQAYEALKPVGHEASHP